MNPIYENQVYLYEGEMPYEEYIIADATSPIPMQNGDVQGMRRVAYRFPNGYGASVVMGWGAYSTPKRPYEVAPLTPNYGAVFNLFDHDRRDPYGFIDDEELYVLLTKILTYQEEK